MKELDLIQLQVKRGVASMEMTITRYYDALREFKRLSLMLFEEIEEDRQKIDAWLSKEEFGIDADGFWLSLPLLRQFRSGKAPENSISYSWSPELREHPEARFRMYCLRNIGAHLKEIRDNLPGAAWIYYQDITNTAIEFPYIDQSAAITPDFDWSTYHTWLSAAPERNPERAIRWTSPTIDYAGEGLILSVSIPVYQKDRFIGLWSIDVPMEAVYKDYVSETYIHDQVNFIVNYNGDIVVHPDIPGKIDKRKGSVYRENLSALGGDFAGCDVSTMIEKEYGDFMLKDDQGRKRVVYYGNIHEIEWIFLATFPRSRMLNLVDEQIREAFEYVKKGDLTHRIENVAGIEQANLLVEGYNEMAKALQAQEESRKKAEHALRRSEERFRTFVENADDAFFLSERNGRFVDVNQAACASLGYTREELLELSIPDIDIQYSAADLARFVGDMSHGESRGVESIHRRKDGTTFFVEIRVRLFRSAEKPLFLSLARDVSERRKTERALRESEARSRNLIEQAPYPVQVFNIEGETVQVNRAWEKLWATSWEELLERGGYNILKDEQLGERGLAKHVEKAFSGEYTVIPVSEYIVQTPRGEGVARHVSSRACPVKDDRGRIQGVLLMQEDVTERKRAESELKKARSYIANIIDSMPSMLIGVDIDGRVTQWNKTAEKTTGVASDVARGKALSDVFPRLASETEQIADSIRIRKIKQDRKTHRLAENGIRYEDVTIYPLIANGVEGAVIRIDDVTERVRIEELEIAKEKAEAANKAKSVFLANMSHEIRTPLNAVTGFSELLSSLVTDPRKKSYLKSIKTAGKTLLLLINDILDLSRIEAERMALFYEPVSLRLVLDEIGQILKMKITKKNLQFTIDVDKDLPRALMLDETRIRQVLLNLAGNAVKFTDRGYIRITVKKSFKTDDRRKVDLTITVEDTGIGIREEDREAIFESFKQRYGQSARKYGGTGLGLTISKKLVEMMGGRITVKSEWGVGSTFEISLNGVLSATLEEAAKDEDLERIDNITFEKAKILVVDDVESNRDLLKEMLVSVNLDVLTADNGEAAILLAEEYRPDAIIMDIRMPVMDGVEATKRLKNNPKTMNTPIIILTASSRLRDRERMLKLGLDGYLVKPIRTRELLGELARYLEPLERKEPENVDRGGPSTASIVEAMERSPELREIIREEVAPACGELSRAMKMKDIRAFGEKLKTFGREYNVEALRKYGTNLDEAAKSYGLADIDNILDELQEMKEPNDERS